MDANVTGRGELGGALADFKGPKIIRIVVLGLTKITSGNAHGIGHADIVTERVFEQPEQPYTRRLIDAAFSRDGKQAVAQ